MSIKARIIYAILIGTLNVIGNNIGSALIAIMGLALPWLVIIPALSRKTKLDSLHEKLTSFLSKGVDKFEEVSEKLEQSAKKLEEAEKSKAKESIADSLISDDFLSRAASVSNWTFFGEMLSARLVDEIAISQITKEMIGDDNYFKTYRIIEYKIRGDIYQDLETDFDATPSKKIKDKSKLFKSDVEYNFRITAESYFNIGGTVQNLEDEYSLVELYGFNISIDTGESETSEEVLEHIETWGEPILIPTEEYNADSPGWEERYVGAYVIERGSRMDLDDINNNVSLWKETGFEDIRSGKKPKVEGNNIGFEQALGFGVATSLKMYPGVEPLAEEEKESAYYAEDWPDGLEIDLILKQAPK